MEHQFKQRLPRWECHWFWRRVWHLPASAFFLSPACACSRPGRLGGRNPGGSCQASQHSPAGGKQTRIRLVKRRQQPSHACSIVRAHPTSPSCGQNRRRPAPCAGNILHCFYIYMPRAPCMYKLNAARVCHCGLWQWESCSTEQARLFELQVFHTKFAAWRATGVGTRSLETRILPRTTYVMILLSCPDSQQDTTLALPSTAIWLFGH